jgi:hypothetical protein
MCKSNGNLSIKTASHLIFVSLLLFILQGCIGPKGNIVTKIDDEFSLPGHWKHKRTDAYHGYCTRQGDTLFYNRKNLSESENLSPILDFNQAFRSYHYEFFFDFIFFDKKLRRLYRDSVKIDSVRLLTDNVKLILPCKGCNSYAGITFRGQHYLYPHSLPQDLVDIMQIFDVYEKEKPGEYFIIHIPGSAEYPSMAQLAIPDKDSVIHFRLVSDKARRKQFEILRGIVFHRAK